MNTLSLIRMDKNFMSILKKKKELKIANLIFTYEIDEILAATFCAYLGDKTNQIMFLVTIDAEELMIENDNFKADIVLFSPDNNKTALFLTNNQWQFIEQYIPYSTVDIPQSIKYGTIFYE